MLDQQPVDALAAAAVMFDAHQHPASLELAAGEHELQFAVGERTYRIYVRLGCPVAAIPQHDCAATVFALRDGALEIAVGKRVILDLDGESLFDRIERGTTCHGPRLENPVDLQPKIVVQARSVVLLDDETEMLGGADFGARIRLAGFGEVTFGAVLFELLHHR